MYYYWPWQGVLGSMKKNKKSNRQKEKKRHSSRPQVKRSEFDWIGLIIFVVVAGLVSGWAFFEGATIIFGIMIGLLLTLAGLTYIDPKKWPPRPVISSLLGATIGYTASIEASASSGIIVLSIIVGLIVGLFAANWVQYLTLP